MCFIYLIRLLYFIFSLFITSFFIIVCYTEINFIKFIECIFNECNFFRNNLFNWSYDFITLLVSSKAAVKSCNHDLFRYSLRYINLNWIRVFNCIYSLFAGNYFLSDYSRHKLIYDIFAWFHLILSSCKVIIVIFMSNIINCEFLFLYKILHMCRSIYYIFLWKNNHWKRKKIIMVK